MQLSIKSPREFINPLLSKRAIDKDAFELFKRNLDSYKKSIQSQHQADLPSFQRTV